MTVPLPDARGRFGPFGGRYVPETLMGALDELEKAYERARADSSFELELDSLLHNYAGRPHAALFCATSQPAHGRCPHLPEA